MVRYDITKIPQRNTNPGASPVGSQFFTYTDKDNIGFYAHSVTTILLSDDADMEYQLNVSLNETVIGNKPGITKASTDFHMYFDTNEANFFGIHDISASAEYPANNWNSLGYIRPTYSGISWNPTVLDEFEGFPVEFSFPRITNNRLTAPVTIYLNFFNTADTASITLNDSSFSPHPNITNKYKVRANVDGTGFRPLFHKRERRFRNFFHSHGFASQRFS